MRQTIHCLTYCTKRARVASMTKESFLLNFCLIGVYSTLVSSFQSQQIVGKGIKLFNPQQVFIRAMTTLRESQENILLPPSEEDGNLARWEKMYFGEGSAEGRQIEEETVTRSEIRVVTFDLDNTIWKTSSCIDAANRALFDHLATSKVSQPKRVEKIMGEIFAQDKKKYSPLSEGDNPKSPVLLTELRIDAIKHILQLNGFQADHAETFARDAFGIWAKARHDAIPQNLASNVLDCLQKIASMKTSAGHPVLIGAITDGNSDPRNVNCLKDFFHFCVNAESVGVSKPDKRVYLEAIRHVVDHPAFKDTSCRSFDSEEELENFAGPFWVHIGDDFTKDIVAAKLLKMRTIWSTELIKEKLEAIKNEKNEENRKMEDFVKEIAEKAGPIKMPIGTDSYLADTVTQEFVDKEAKEFNNLSEILLTWHRGGSRMEETVEDMNEDQVTVPEVLSDFPSDETIFLNEDDFVPSRTFRLVREDCTMDIPAPFKNRETQTMKDVMTIAQLDKSSGVFSFLPESMKSLQEGKLVLMVGIGDTGLKFSKDVFQRMSVQEILSVSDENPLTLSLYMQDAIDPPSFDLF